MWLHYFLIIYILAVGIFLGAGKQTNLKRKTYIVLTFGVFLILMAFRAESVGNDTVSYVRLFRDISLTGDVSIYFSRYEIGYLYLNKILSLITTQPQVIIIVTSVITIFGFARFILKYSEIPWLSTYLFFTLRYYGTSMNIVRLNIAIVIILLSYDFLIQSKLLKFIFTVILASLFHRTAIVFLIAWPITKLNYNYKTLGTSLVTTFSLYVLFPVIFPLLLFVFPIYQYYLDSTYMDGNIRTASIMNMLVGLSIVVFGIFISYKKNHFKEKVECGDINLIKNLNGNLKKMLFLIMAGVSITFVSFRFNLLGRVDSYFIVFSCVYLPNIIKQLKNRKLINLIIFIVVLLFFTYATTIQIIRPEWNVIYPYRFFWQS
jgi:hypothetical protein